MTQNFNVIKFNFQDPATPVAEGIIDLHNYIIFYLIIVLVFVIAILIDLFIQNYEVYRIKKDFDLFFKCKTNFKFRRDFDLKPRYSSFFPLFAIVGFVLLAIVTQKPTVFLEIASLVMPATEVQSTNAVGHNKLFLRESSHFPAHKGPGTGLEGPVIRGGQRLAESSVSFTKSEMLNLQEFVDNIEQSSEFLVLPTTLKMEATVILRHPLALTYHSDYFFSPTSSLFIEFSRILDDPSFQFEDGSCLSFINPDIIRRPPLNPLLFLCNRFSLIDRTLSECIDPSLICRLSWSGYSKACDDWVCGFADMSVLLSNQIFFDELSSIVENIDVNCFDSVLYPKIVSDFDYLRSNLLEELKEISFEASQFCDLLPSAVQSGYSKHKAGQLFRLKFNLDRLENIEFFYHNTNLFCEEWNFFFSALQKDQPIVYPTSRTQPRITDIIYGGEVSQVVDVYKGLSLDYLTKTSSLVDVVSTDFEVMMLRNKKVLFFLFVRGGAGFII